MLFIGFIGFLLGVYRVYKFIILGVYRVYKFILGVYRCILGVYGVYVGGFRVVGHAASAMILAPP